MLGFNFATQQAGNILPSILMFALVGAMFYFMILRPQKKQQQKMQETMQSLKVGDHVITRAGVRGVVSEVKGDSFILETGPQKTQIEYLKQAISYVEAENKSNESVFNNEPVGDLSYGNDTRFIDKLNELKDNHPNIEDYDLLLEDVFEYIVVKNTTNIEDIQKTFRLDEERAAKILEQLTELGILSEDIDEKEILVDPRN